MARADLEEALVRARAKRALFDIEAPPARVGRFAILDKLGAGATGRVFAAYDPELDRKVALKLLRLDAGDDQNAPDERARERLLREARAMANIAHPHVLTVYEAGSVGDEVFVAMEYAPGGTLRRWRGESARGWREVLDACLDAARGLAAAHAAGIVHRDFKPDNVLLSAAGRVRVADFGVAGELLGTPAYMAPEQHRRQPATPASDQFAFCVTAWELFYGERPFRGASYRELADQIFEGSPHPPPPGSDVPGWIREALLRGLKPDPKDRHRSLEKLIELLEAHRNRAKRRIQLAGTIALAIAVAAVASAVTRESTREPMCRDPRARLAEVWDDARGDRLRATFAQIPRAEGAYQRTAEALDAFATSWVTAHQEACAATHVDHRQSAALLDLRVECLNRQRGDLLALLEVLAQTKDAEVIARAAGAARRLPSPAWCSDVERLRARVPLPADPDARARIKTLRAQLERGRALAATGQWQHARPLAEAALAEARALAWPSVRAEAALLVYTLGPSNLDDGERLLEEIAMAGAEAGDDAVIADAWIRKIIKVGYVGGQHAEALRLRPIAEVAVARAGREPLLEAGLANAVGIVLDEQGEHQAARDQFRRSLALRERALGPDHPDVAASLNNLGDSFYLDGQLAEARAHHQRSLAIKERTLGPIHPDVAASAHNLGAVALDLGEYREARAWIERAIECWAPSQPVPDAPPPVLVQLLGDIALAEGDPPAALAHMRRALEITDRFGVPEQSHRRAELELGLARALRASGDSAGALAAIESAVKSRETVYGAEHRETAAAKTARGSLLLALGRRSEARVELEEALRVSSKVAGDAHVDTIASILAFADWHASGDDPLEAGRLYARALHGAEAGPGGSHPLAGAALAGAADTWMRSGDRRRAYAAYERAVAIFASRPGADAARRGRARLALAELLPHAEEARARGLRAQAEADFRAAGARR